MNKNNNKQLRTIKQNNFIIIQKTSFMSSQDPHNESSMNINEKNQPFSHIEVMKNEIIIGEEEKSKILRSNLGHLYKNDYMPARYEIAVQCKNALSYKKKESDGTYRQLGLFQKTDQLKAFGLGPYFFIEYQRRIVWLFFVLSLLVTLMIIINFKGTGLENYGTSISAYLFRSTLGNYNGTVLSDFDAYLQASFAGIVFLAFFIFFLIWVAHYSKCVSEQEESAEFIKPEKFCVEVTGFENLQHVAEKQLSEFFRSFGPIYQLSLIREFAGKLSYFQTLQSLEEKIKEEELEAILSSGNEQNLTSLKDQKQQIEKQIHNLKIKPTIIGAYVHFQFEQSKVDMVNYFTDYYMFKSFGHSFVRSLCCCCIDQIDEQYIFKGEKLYIKNDKVPQPQDINWQNHQISVINKICRVLFAFFIFLIFLVLSCLIIGLCSVYISGNTIDCTEITFPSTVPQAKANNLSDEEKKCFCYSKLISSFQNRAVQNYCGEVLELLYTEQGIQYAIIITSGAVNFLFGLLVNRIVNFTRPGSHSSGYMMKNALYTSFMIFNTVLLPLLIYANIFGVKIANYISFITIFSSGIRNFLQVDSISFNQDFQPIWYRNVSPIFTNYVIIDTLFTILFFVVYKFMSRRNLKDKQGKILQKHMNQKMTTWKLNAFIEYSYFNLIMFLCIFYCCGIPVLIPLGFVNLLVKYLSNRSLLQNNSSKIEGLSERFNLFPHTLIPIMLILGALFGNWMLTANDWIYPDHMTVSLNFSTTLGRVLNRSLYIPWLFILAVLVAFYFLFYNLVVRFCSWLVRVCSGKREITESYRTQEYSHYSKSMSMLTSYNIRHNPKFKNVILNLEKYLDEGQKI